MIGIRAVLIPIISRRRIAGLKRVVTFFVILILIICSFSGCKANDDASPVPDPSPAPDPTPAEETVKTEIAALNTFTASGLAGYSRLESEDGSLSVSVHYFDFEDRTVSTFDCIPCGYVVNPILFVLDDKIWVVSDSVYHGGGNIENFEYDHLCYVIDLKTKTMDQLKYDESVDISYGFSILTEGDKKYLIVNGVDYGTEEYPSYGNADLPYWILDLDSLSFSSYDGPVFVADNETGYSLKADPKATYIGSNSRGRYFYSYTPTGKDYRVEGRWTLWCQTEDKEYTVTEDMFPIEYTKAVLDFKYYASVGEDFIIYPGTSWEPIDDEWKYIGSSYFIVDLNKNSVKAVSIDPDDPVYYWLRCEYQDYYVFSTGYSPMGSNIIGADELVMIKKEDFLNGELNWLYFQETGNTSLE